MKNEIIIFEEENIKLEVNMQDATVWLNVNQISELFARDVSVIRKHVRNVLVEEGDEKSNRQFLPVTNSDKPVPFYNLDVIISVGYRVKSERGIKFRRWANKVIKEHLIHGYTVNQQRLDYLEKTVKVKVKFK